MLQDAEVMNSLWDEMVSAQRRHAILMAELERTKQEIAATCARIELLARTMEIPPRRT
jgi:hypothetical protein